jgi:hypothetical protein
MEDREVTKYFQELFTPVNLSSKWKTYKEKIFDDKVRYSSLLQVNASGSVWLTINDQALFVYWYEIIISSEDKDIMVMVMMMMMMM